MSMLTGAGSVAGVLGWPVAHSRSPRLHNFWLDRYNIDGAYVPLPTSPADFAAAVQGVRAAGLRGANVTIPHKETAFALCNTVDGAARAAGAVNTLVFGPNGIHGSNTDGSGFIANVSAQGVAVGAGPILVLGAGGAARAIVASLLALGADVIVTNRSVARTDALARAMPRLKTILWADRIAALADMAMVVNTTPVGMQATEGSPISLEKASNGLTVADIIYVPRTTPLLAEAAGARLTERGRPGDAGSSSGAWLRGLVRRDAQRRCRGNGTHGAGDPRGMIPPT